MQTKQCWQRQKLRKQKRKSVVMRTMKCYNNKDKNLEENHVCCFSGYKLIKIKIKPEI
jgi:hypothetical protein